MRIRTSVQAHLSALCLSTIMSSNCSPAFNRWMTGYFTFQQTAAMRIRRMEKSKSFFQIGRKSSRHRKSHFAPKLISKPKPRQDSLFSTGTKKAGKSGNVIFPEWNRPSHFISPLLIFVESETETKIETVELFLFAALSMSSLLLSMSTSSSSLLSLLLLMWLWSSLSSLLSLLLWSSSLPRWFRG